MDEVACECDDLPPHSHIYEHLISEAPNRVIVSRRTDEIRIWVDWREVARSMMVTE